jgi:hypothetical protein
MNQKSQHTVVIAGAGASVAYGFPDSAGLLGKLCSNEWPPEYDGKADFNHASCATRFEYHKRIVAELSELAQASSAWSFDAFAARQQLQEGLHHFITAWIMFHEARWRERLPARGDRCWIRSLLAGSECKGNEFIERAGIAFATFNYDRMIEHALTVRLHADGASPRRGTVWKSIRSRIPIIHVFGTPYEYDCEDQPSTMGFGAKPLYPRSVLSASENIAFNYEQQSRSRMFPTIANLIRGSRQVVVLGLGVAVDDLAEMVREAGSHPRMFVCGFGWSDQDRRERQKTLEQAGATVLHIGAADVDACSFIDSLNWYGDMSVVT